MSSRTLAPPRMRWPRFRVSERRILLVVGDIVLTGFAVALALLLCASHVNARYDAGFLVEHAYWFVILPGIWVVLAGANDYYSLRVAARVMASLGRLVAVLLQLLLLYLATFFFSPPGSLPRRFIAYYAVLSLVLVGLWRACRIFLLGWSGFRRRVLVVGGGRASEMIREVIAREANEDYEVVGLVTSAHDLGALTENTSDLPRATGSDLPALARQLGASDLILAYAGEVPDDVFDGLMRAYEQGANVVPMPVLYEQITGRMPIEHVGDALWPLVLPLEKHTAGFMLYLLGKRLMDLTLATLGLTAFALLLPLLALAITLDSRGPVFYRQERLGRAGRAFQVLKLRTMWPDAERVSGPIWAKSRDMRMTRVGRVLRKTRLDELPQLVNVLRGEMSIVGPRPERSEFVARLAAEIPFYRTRLVVKPGLTGWAQVRYRYGSSTEDALRKLQYDLYYIRHQSLLFDLSICLRTVGTMLLLRGQ